MVLSNIDGFAQLGYTEKQINGAQGEYLRKVINDTSILLYYNPNLNTDYGKPPESTATYHIDRKTGKCYYIVYVSPYFVADSYYETLKSIALKIDVNTWSANKENSIYQVNLKGLALKVEHCYLPLKSTISTTNLNSTILSLQNELNAYKIENQGLSATVNGLKEHNRYLINSSKDMTVLTTKGAENIEKVLKSIKEKDLKITMMQEALIKRDSVMLEYIKELKKKSDKK
jgi:hypothetical protein